MSHSLGTVSNGAWWGGERRCSCYERLHPEYVLKASSTVEKWGFEMAKPAKSDQLGTGAQRLCRKPPRHARPWPERKSTAPSRGATLTANASERSQPANRGQLVEGQGFRPSRADKVARRRLSNRPNISGLNPRAGSCVIQMNDGAFLLAEQMQKRPKKPGRASRPSIRGEGKRLQGPVALNLIYHVRPVRHVRNRPCPSE